MGSTRRRRGGAGGAETNDVGARLVELASGLAERWPEAAAALYRRRPDLERRLGRAGLVRFAEEGLALGERRGAEAAHAFFRLESRTAHEALVRAQRRVRLEDWLGALRLYAEALAASPVELRAAPAGAESEGYRARLDSPPGTDGLRLLLPEESEVVAGAKGDLALFKLGILHQLARYSSGTYSFDLDRLVEARPDLDSRLRRVATAQGSAFGRFFSTFRVPGLARRLFAVLDGARVDRWIAGRYAGARVDLEAVRAHLLARRPPLAELDAGAALLELLVRWSLGGDPLASVPAQLEGAALRLVELAAPAAAPGATVLTVAGATVDCYALFEELGLALRLERELASRDRADEEEAAPTGLRLEAVAHRGWVEPDEIQARLELSALRQRLEGEAGAEPSPTAAVLALLEEALGDPLGALALQDGELFAASGLLQCAEDGGPIAGSPAEGEGGAAAGPVERMGELVRELETRLQQPPSGSKPGRPEAYFYDEWDHEISDYRRRWCRLTEVALEEEESDFCDQARARHGELLERIRRQFQLLEPELRRPVRGLVDGEELDLDAAIQALLDRRAGRTPSEKVYLRRQRIERDVAAAFLLDLSASTDSEVPSTEAAPAPAPAQPVPDFVGVLDDDLLFGGGVSPWAPRRRVIDIEKEALVLMAEALETLGDAYAVYGFSGFGRMQVDFYVAKEFADPFDLETQRRIAAMRPRQSTRMGPAIRHALAKLVAQEARLKTLLVLSDGYPQDHDYGRHRASREYGIRDTMMALREAQLRGVHTFCITVDPAGHDYLRAMCPDERYLVIDDIAALPDELPKVYRALTT